MSEVMKALQQSEQAYQAQISQPHLSSPARVNASKTTRWWLVGVFAVLPIIAILAVMAYLHFNQTENTSSQLEATDASKNQQQATRLEPNESSEPLAKLLPYPELTGLAVLPKAVAKPLPVKPKPTTTVSRNNAPSEGRRIKTDQVNVSHGSKQDWNVDDLDLSGLSPELAQRFQSALEKHPAQSKPQAKTTVTPTKPQDAINLVGHESDYRGRLPKMNFETHMYSSKSQSRWIKVNGNNVHEGEWVINKLVKLDLILPGSLIVTFDNQQLQIPALYEWQG
ncbi:general secretion pathway protein GspB [Vibrio sp. CK2-1]|uniref:general secretion pathway protein GspB n=1 Tax=Vibrio sp. CK2-1 TaxID=2912249 RepID=UPI001F38255A|nr:general secretion pathway protein GspB [Vibrio sp. CK2-1]MCF7353778.1 general secretion pathway protein GspB [Vibrio sp. CK2-1]